MSGANTESNKSAPTGLPRFKMTVGVALVFVAAAVGFLSGPIAGGILGAIAIILIAHGAYRFKNPPQPKTTSAEPVKHSLFARLLRRNNSPKPTNNPEPGTVYQSPLDHTSKPSHGGNGFNSPKPSSSDSHTLHH